MAENPYKYLLSLTKTSQKDFAAKYDLSKMTITAITTGQLPDLSERMIVSLGQECYEKHVDAAGILNSEYSVGDLQTAYHNWQSSERIQVAHLFKNPPSDQLLKETSPVALFIQQTTKTRQAFCKALKVPAATVMRYERGVTGTMPVALQDALKEVSYPYIDELKELQDAWRSL